MLLPKEIDICAYNEKALHLLKGIQLLTEKYDPDEDLVHTLKLDAALIKTALRMLKDLKNINAGVLLGLKMHIKDS